MLLMITNFIITIFASNKLPFWCCNDRSLKGYLFNREAANHRTMELKEV